ncbi:CAAX farnesyltransferase (FTase) subunit beta [Spiromyces aspiralis]|uniref:CAAX farnesyltransferase (FTase) subunit beta n=1 Tax=Spiromyces aspiralis TaxID=68401 RepID=A0ACC1HFL3_9FUNG|nr:CAAX farnesyltransferase (FTase) subunit beta [Spiromyces aspiralis]
MDRVPDDYFPTSTSMAQGEVENAVKRKYAKLFVSVGGSLSAMDARLKLYRDDHIKYLLNLLEGLPPEFDVLDAIRAFSHTSSPSINVVFFLVSLICLSTLLTVRLVGRVSQFRQVSEDGTGGFAGGDCQLPHLVSCYAAVMEAIYKWFMKIKQPDGSFLVHEGGEIDVRGSYCVAVIGSLLNILTPELLENVPEFIARQVRIAAMAAYAKACAGVRADNIR